MNWGMWCYFSTSRCENSKTDHLKEPFWMHQELDKSFIIYTWSVASRGDHKDMLISSRHTEKKKSLKALKQT